jgi:hypothetical protein
MAIQLPVLVPIAGLLCRVSGVNVNGCLRIRVFLVWRRSWLGDVHRGASVKHSSIPGAMHLKLQSVVVKGFMAIRSPVLVPIAGMLYRVSGVMVDVCLQMSVFITATPQWAARHS